MAISELIATAGATNANTYVTLAFADQYNEDRPQNDSVVWNSADPADKSSALMWATKQLDVLYTWSGWVLTETQALLWPRAGLLYRNGYNIPDDVIPLDLQYATAEFARQLLADDLTANSDIETQGITSLKAGSVSLTFGAGVRAKPTPDAVRNFIPAEWGVIVSSSMTRDLVRV